MIRGCYEDLIALLKLILQDIPVCLCYLLHYMVLTKQISILRLDLIVHRGQSDEGTFTETVFLHLYDAIYFREI